MIILANPSKPFQMTPKGTPRRRAILEDYAQEIEDVYTAFDKPCSFSSGTVPRREISMKDMLEIVRTHVQAHISSNISDNEDMFEAGADR